jgi:IclR family pca regulon transcriptional regulator
MPEGVHLADQREKEFVQALDRGLAVVRTFSREHPTLTMAQVAARTNVPRAVARRYLFTLESLGYVQQRDGRFMLTPKVLDLGYSYLSSLTLPALAQPILERLGEELHESCSVSVLDGREIVYVARVPAQRIMSINLGVGSRLPAHATSMGKVLLASLPARSLDEFFAKGPLEAMTRRTIANPADLRRALQTIREAGWAVADQESEDGVRSIAAPIVDGRGETKAAMNVSAHVGRTTVAQLCKDVLPRLLDAARDISRALGATR